MPKLTTAQATVLHIIVSLIVGIVVSSGQASYEYFTLHSFNFGATLAYFFMSLIAALLTLPASIIHTLATNPALPQAESDTVSEIKNTLETHARNIENALSGWLVGIEQRLAGVAKVSVPAAPAQPVQQGVPTSSGGVVRQSWMAPVAPTTTPNTPPVGATLVHTLPDITAVKPAQ